MRAMVVSIADQFGREQSICSPGLDLYAYQHTVTEELHMTTCTMPTSIPLHRPVWQRAWDVLQDAWNQWSPMFRKAHDEMSLQDAMSLNDHTLRDIGVSDVLRDEAAARRSLDASRLRASQLTFDDPGRRWYG
jgi:hypothetical protein